MSGMPALYCRRCNDFREVEDWHERGEALVIALEPCGHEIRRRAGIEWPTHEVAA
ncbi:MAG TPA: hypothetical protein VGB86_10565 [Methylomirabilota bacterium]|jgi:hypothetical protein